MLVLNSGAFHHDSSSSRRCSKALVCADNINNWDYVGLVRALDNGQWNSFATRVCPCLISEEARISSPHSPGETGLPVAMLNRKAAVRVCVFVHVSEPSSHAGTFCLASGAASFGSEPCLCRLGVSYLWPAS